MAQSDDRRVAAIDAATLLQAWFETDHRPTLIVEAHHNVLWMNRAAAQVVSASSIVNVRGSAFHATDVQQDGLLTQHLAAATSAPSCCLLADDEGSRIAILIQQITSGGPPIYGVRLVDPDAIIYANLHQVFSLTHAEDRILRGLLEGLVAEEISQKYDTSTATVRSQIKSIYAKVGVSSREALFSKTGLYRIS